MRSRVKKLEHKLKSGRKPVCVRWRFVDEEGEWNDGGQKCVLKRYQEVAAEECDKCQGDVKMFIITWHMKR